MPLLRLRQACVGIGFIAALSLARPAHACQGPINCSEDPAKRLQDADVVFRGRVLAYEDHEPLFELSRKFAVLRSVGRLLDLDITAEFEVIEAWKGVDTRTVRILGRRSSCGYPIWKLERGAEMLVMANIIEGEIKATHCSRPIPIDHEFAQRLLPHLGRGERPSVGFADLRFAAYWLPLLALPLGWWYWRRRRASSQAL